MGLIEIDRALQRIKDLEVEKEDMFKKKGEAELNYIKKSAELRMANIELSKLMDQTKPIRRQYPRPDKMWKDSIINQVGRCEECLSVTDLQLHHKIPLGSGGSNKKENLQVLCRPCHKIKHPEWR